MAAAPAAADAIAAALGVACDIMAITVRDRGTIILRPARAHCAVSPGETFFAFYELKD